MPGYLTRSSEQSELFTVGIIREYIRKKEIRTLFTHRRVWHMSTFLFPWSRHNKVDGIKKTVKPKSCRHNRLIVKIIAVIFYWGYYQVKCKNKIFFLILRENFYNKAQVWNNPFTSVSTLRYIIDMKDLSYLGRIITKRIVVSLNIWN